MATTDCVIPISGLSADGTATLCGVMTSPSEILLTPVLAQNENGYFAVTAPSSTFLSHLKPAQVGAAHQQPQVNAGLPEKTVKFVQFVLNGGPPAPSKGRIRVIPEAAIRKTTPSPPSSPLGVIDESCTICGQHYVDRSAFNAHIKQHLKEKLRRNKRKLQEESERKSDKISKTTNPGNTDIIMAELAACTPVPPEAICDISAPPPNPLIFPPTPASSICSAPSPAKPPVELPLQEGNHPHSLPEEKMDLVNYDLNNILDEIEQNLDPLQFESNNNSSSSMETPPDSDTEIAVKEEVDKHTSSKEEDGDKVDLDKLVNEAISSSSSSLERNIALSSQSVIQSASSIAKVGALPPKALAVLNQLPSKLFGSSDGNRFINVVKVERSGGNQDLSNTIINIQCQNSKNNKSSRKELKLIPNSGRQAEQPLGSSEPPSKNCSSECSICGKTSRPRTWHATWRNTLGRKSFNATFAWHPFFQKTHLKNHIALHKSGGIMEGCTKEEEESSSPEPYHNCPHCPKSFVQKGHLNRHLKSYHSKEEEGPHECKICHKKCKNKVCLNRHRTKHLVCAHCTGPKMFFNSKLSLQEHLLQFHPEAAVLSVESYNNNGTNVIHSTPSSSSSASTSSEEDALGLSEREDAFLDYLPLGGGRCSSSSYVKDEKLPFSLLMDGSSSCSSSLEREDEDDEQNQGSGASIADISNSDYFDFNQELKEFILTIYSKKNLYIEL
ncbi:Zinc finger protein 710, partial [Caligus rogercresseyi]